MDFDVAPSGGAVAFLQRETPAAPMPDDAEAWFRRGEDAEATNQVEAERAYRRAIELAADHEHAHVNLGAILCEAGRCEEAVALYSDAVRAGAKSAMLHYNHAMALEDLGMVDKAVDSYDLALQEDPSFLDAHYNVGMLLEKMGNGQGALRHFSAYRRLNKG